jgi:predicted transcriptional regulator
MQLSLFEEELLTETGTMVNILLSIHDIYCQRIFDKKKKYEYRVNFPKSEVRAYIYVPQKVKAIIGYMDLESPISGSADEISRLYADCGDGNYETMFDYIGRNKVMHAMKIKQAIPFKTPIPLETLKSKFPGLSAPQSFTYLDKIPSLVDYIMKNSR